MNPSFHERDLDILEAIHNRRHIKQRDLAHVLGISVGMTNAIIRRLAQKGFLTVRKVNNRNIRYAVSSQGLEALTTRSVRYLKSTIRNVVDSKQAIEELVVAVKRLGYDKVALVGSSALDFVVEHVCGKFGVGYRQTRHLPGPDPATEDHPPEPKPPTGIQAPADRQAASRPQAPADSQAAAGNQPPAGNPAPAPSPPLAEPPRETYFLFSENYEEPEAHHRECHGYLRTILSSKPSPPPAEAEQIQHSAGGLW
jgi:DNA-binding MarR family transcriptional regulator